ncbi:pilus assembly protein Flp/PilA [Actinacidiphila rubida]|uniref:Pilus assembly protein Flp/PilA n=1 Tax=Actinacidiphila rubida TaxID=310780 RepID=A0A1H8HHQ7_9ACTN|nr:pilus assembly protein Flp/PilA [Actinacidiphila rubida]
MGRTVMKRWALRLHVAMATRRRDAGQTSIEYLGIAVVIVVIIGVLAGTTSIGDTILSAILDKIKAIAGG